MGECICSTCKNLKSFIQDDGEVSEFECQYGYPSEKCEECNEEGCNETCSRYEQEDEEQQARTAVCKACGRELSTMVDENGAGDVFCVDCYFKR